MNLTNIKVDSVENKIYFEGDSEERIHCLVLSYQQIKEYKHPKVKIEVPVMSIGNNFSGELSLTTIFKMMIMDSPTYWEVFAKGVSNIFNVNVNANLIEKIGTIPVLPLLNVSISKGETAQLKLNFIRLQAKMDSYKSDSQCSYIKGIIHSTNGILQNHSVYLQAKRRSNTTLYNFHEEKNEFPIHYNFENNTFEVEILWDKLPKAFSKDDTNIFDIVLVFTNEYGHEVSSYLEVPDFITKEMVERQIPLAKENTIIKPYITGSKRLSFYVLKNNRNLVELNSFSENETHYVLKLMVDPSIDEAIDKQLVLKKRDKKGITHEYIVETKWSITGDTEIGILKETFLSVSGITHASTWDFFLRVEDKDFYITVPDSLDLQSDYIYVQQQFYKAKLFKSPVKMLSCYVILSDKPSSNAINVAVMGTCFSRNMFNSGLYFNPGYKQVLNCSFTQFHSSIMSVMTEPFEFDLSKYTDMTESEKRYVQEDFAKGFFENLRNSKAEYFLIDLYPDVIRPVMWLTKKSAITLSYVIEESELLNDLPFERILDHTDNLTYFNEWKNYVDAFIERLTNIIPPERIILNKGRFTTLYNDKGQKKEFPNKMMIERNNYFWDKLDNYFYSKLPEAQILDIRHKPYIGDIHYPYGNSFSHYQSDYYKDLFKELTFVILKERLNRDPKSE